MNNKSTIRFTVTGATHSTRYTCSKKKCPAFTLAEVLVTLGIIGVVAAMTLPTIIDNSRNKQLESALKKSYSIINQALDLYQAQNGERIKSDGSFAYLQLKPVFIKYFQVARDCGYGFDSIHSCIRRGTSGSKNDQTTDLYKTLNGYNMNTSMFDEGAFVLLDGSIIFIQNGTVDIPLIISVDVNGYNKRPNKLGHDLFMFMIDEKGTLLPLGVKGSIYNNPETFCSPTSKNYLNGAACTYKALTEKDYFKNLPK